MYVIPDRNDIRRVIIDEDVVLGKQSAGLEMKD